MYMYILPLCYNYDYFLYVCSLTLHAWYVRLWFAFCSICVYIYAVYVCALGR